METATYIMFLFLVGLTAFCAVGTFFPISNKAVFAQKLNSEYTYGLLMKDGGLNFIRMLGSKIERLIQPRYGIWLTSIYKMMYGTSESDIRLVLGCKIVSALILVGIGVLVTGKNTGVLIILILFGFFFPDLYMFERATKRRSEIEKELPFALDLMTIMVEAGLGFNIGLEKVVEKGQKGPLREELYIVCKKIVMGEPRADALRSMSLKVGSSEINSFVMALMQAERFGTSIGDILRIIASQVRTRRSQKAHAQAMKAPVKMLFPLVLLIFPVILIMVLGPAILRSI